MTDMSVPIDLIQELWMSSQYGIPLGAALDVPMNYCALIVRNGSILYVLEPNHYLLTWDYFPLLGPIAGLAGTSQMLDGTLYLIRTDEVYDIPWAQQLISTEHWYEGTAYEVVQGRYGVRIVNPPQCFLSMYSRLKALGRANAPVQSFQLANPERDARQFTAANMVTAGNLFVSPLVESALPIAQRILRSATEPVASPRETLQNEIGSRIAPQIQAQGAQLLSFSVDSTSTRVSVPCESCGGDQWPTGKVGFYANVSLLIIRYQFSRKGHFCSWCAFKYFMGYTALTLVMGWWGMIGLVVSPILIGINIVNMGKALLRCRRPRIHEAR